MSDQIEETVPAAPEAASKPVAKKKISASKPKQGIKLAPAGKKKKTKSKGPGKYSQLVIDVIRKLGDKSGSSLVKIYKEARKVDWFDQQHGRVYLRSSIRALLLNDTLVQVRGLGANGSFKINKNKLSSNSKQSTAKPRKKAKATIKAVGKDAKKKKSVKKATSAVKKLSKAKRVDKKPAVSERKKAKKEKQIKKKTERKA